MVDFDRLYDDFVAEIDRSGSKIEAHEIFKRLLEQYSLRTVAYFAVNVPGFKQDEPYLAVTYSREWVEHYKLRRYVEIDPVLMRGFSSILPVDWSEFAETDRRVRNLFGEAAEFGVGRHGLTLPIRGRHGERALFTITSDASDREWTGAMRVYKRDFQVLAYHIHDMVMRSEGVDRDIVHLSPRELECLKWAARGKTTSEIGIILSLSNRTVRFYQDLARAKLDATNITHAVSKAMDLNTFFPGR